MKKIIKTIMMAVACGGLFPAAATAQSYQLVTDNSLLESGKLYLIVAKNSSNNYYYAWNGLDGNSGKAIAISAPSGSFIAPTEETEEVVPVQLVLQAGTDYWKIIDTATEKYVGVPSEDNNNLAGQAIAITDNFLWNISIDGTATVQNASKGYRYLKFNSNLGSPYFGAYGKNELTTISLYKQVNPGSSLILYNGIDNTAIIAAATNSKNNVTLKNRTLYKDGKWNTLCLPFTLSADQIATSDLTGATIMELDTGGKYKQDNNVWTQANDGTHKTGFNASSGTLYLFFKTAESIVAGKPYIIKWDNSSGTIDSPTFSGVTIISSTTSGVTSDDDYVTFKGGYNVKSITDKDKSILFLGSSDKLYYPEDAMSINAFRAYFQLNKGLTVGDPSLGRSQILAFALNLSESNETTGISAAINTDGDGPKGWYTLDGRKLDGKPTKAGIYVHEYRKVVIK